MPIAQAWPNIIVWCRICLSDEALASDPGFVCMLCRICNPSEAMEKEVRQLVQQLQVQVQHVVSGCEG